MPEPVYEAPEYEAWRRYGFTQACADLYRENDEDAEERWCHFAYIPAETILSYLTRCFEEAASLVDDFTAKEIGDAVEKGIFGAESNFFLTLLKGGLQPQRVAQCYRAVATLYRDCFDRMCCRGAADPDGDYINLRSVDDGASDYLDGAVYMIWDTDTIDVAIAFPDEHPELFEASVDVLRDVLLRCRTSTCKISALHGVGHLHDASPDVATRLVDEYLERPGQPQWVIEYALRARRGGVQ